MEQLTLPEWLRLFKGLNARGSLEKCRLELRQPPEGSGPGLGDDIPCMGASPDTIRVQAEHSSCFSGWTARPLRKTFRTEVDSG
jgi:hypothetical protein